MGMFLTPATRRLAGVGVELAGGALGFGAIGYLADRWIGWQTPWLAVVGVLMGFALGMYRLIRMANEISQRYDQSTSGVRGGGEGRGSDSPAGSGAPADRTEVAETDRRGQAGQDRQSGQGRGPG
ncbi:AtpZ/AtpI family protein [Crateriforma spongiae]|uniref:AtpZ/AtpI family protein n=1 Tax=Crateriforma spongiae TaxID=2724528 RepID=UPI00144735A4|nr:AtpZ/AtpI family protein [Crateriforma spongiae]